MSLRGGLTSMAAKVTKKIIKLISFALIGIILISVIADFRADMYVKSGGGGKNSEEPRDNGQAQTVQQTPSGNQISTSNATSGSNVVNVNNFVYANNTGVVNNTTGLLPGTQSINPLTGKVTANNNAQNRPVAVSISNQRGALPTNAVNGISDADIVYEFLIEGGGTRFIGIFQNFINAGVVGSIRSARHYMVELAESYDALFIHAGGSPLGFEEIDTRGITAFDAVRGIRAQIFNKDVNRVPGHTVLDYHGQTTSGALFSKYLPSYDIRVTHPDRFAQALFFTDNPIPSGSRAHNVTARFSSAKNSTFTYDNAQNLYYMNQYGSQLTDANNNAPVAFTNLLILEIPIADLVGHGEGAGRQDMSTVGIGDGYFVSAGRHIEIIWFRPDKSSQFIYADANGDIIDFGRGKTYIAIVPEGADIIIN